MTNPEVKKTAEKELPSTPLRRKLPLTSFRVVGWTRGKKPETVIVEGYSEGQVMRDLQRDYPGWQFEVMAARNVARNPGEEAYGYQCRVCEKWHRNDSRIGVAHDPARLRAFIKETWGKGEG